MGAVSLWTRPPALYLCTGPQKIYPSSQLSGTTAGSHRCMSTATSTTAQELHLRHLNGIRRVRTMGICRTRQPAGTRPAKQGHRSPRTRTATAESLGLLNSKTIGIGLCTMTGMSTTNDDKQLQKIHSFLRCLTKNSKQAYHLDQELHLWSRRGRQQQAQYPVQELHLWNRHGHQRRRTQLEVYRHQQNQPALSTANVDDERGRLNTPKASVN